MDDPNQATNIEKEIEKQLRQTDVFAHRYLELIAQFGDLPDCDTLIMPKLIAEFGKEKVDELLGDAPWEDNDSDMMPQDDEEDHKGEFMENDGRKQSPIEENSGKAASLIASSLLGWCNIYGMTLSKQERIEAMRILYLLSKAFSFLVQALDIISDMEYSKAVVLLQRCKRFGNWARQRLSNYHVEGLNLDSPFENIIECLDDAVEPLNKLILEYRRLDQNDLPF
ncbi:MAG: hypothetical protein K5787_20460 [Lentisphaeria bacterium]|nr:hypothetical protein [Victivallales bacterium]MBR6057498.1 hypothetical protein [Victivallales bacterium]MCR4576137.1 hypothetical protein [Lentisphaeria bacterium]